MNNYFTSYEDTKKHIDYLKYGLFVERGINIDRKNMNTYNEEEIIKIKRTNFKI